MAHAGRQDTAFHTEPMDERTPDIAVPPMPLQHGHRQHVLLLVRIHPQVVCDDAAVANADDRRVRTALWNDEIVCRDFPATHRMQKWIRSVQYRYFIGREQLSLCERGGHLACFQIIQQDDVRAFSGGDEPTVVQSKHIGGGHGRHAVRHQRIHSRRDDMGDDGIEMPFLRNVQRIAVIRAKRDIRRILKRDDRHQLIKIPCRGPFTDEDVHAARNLLLRFLHSTCFVAVADAGEHVCVQSVAGKQRAMAVDIVEQAELRHDLRIFKQHAGHVHEFRQPCGRIALMPIFQDIRRNRRASRLQRRGGNA